MSRSRPAVLTVLAAMTCLLGAACSTAAHPAASVSPRAPDPPLTSASRFAPRVPANGAYFGAWIRPATYTPTSQLLAVDELQSELGRRLDIVHTYLPWTAKFPTPSDIAVLGQGSQLLLSWTGTSSSSIVSGRDDRFIRERALQIKATRKPVYLEYRWEMNRPNLTQVVGSPAEFVAAWKHVRTIFAHEHVNNAAWVWCPTDLGFGSRGNAAAYYPGDAEVDWLCTDVYPGYGPYRSFEQAAQPFLNWAAHHRKPIIIGEYGAPRNYTPQERAQWLRAAAQTVRSNPQVKALVYFDANPAGALPANSYGLDEDSPALQAFRDVGDSSYFNPRHLRITG